MKIATVRNGSDAAQTQAAVLDGGRLRGLSYPDVGAWLAAGSPPVESAYSGTEFSLDDVRFAPLVPQPGKIVCVGLNYREHILEMGRDLPEHPTLFAKFADALIGAEDDIVLPPSASRIDWEVELTVVIGRRVSRGSRAEAEKAIAGFTIANDISARDYQRRTLQWLQGKTFDNTTPLGPYLTTVDETGAEPHLDVSCSVNSVVKQSANTADLLFTPVELVEYISTITTLRPGDIILTGTPGGVGEGREPQEFLVNGDVVTTVIDGLGQTTNLCVTA